MIIAPTEKPQSSHEWYTPQRYIEAAREVLGGIDLDPASSALANETVKAARYFTIDDDGLSKTWRNGGGGYWMQGMAQSTIWHNENQ